jgi:hypothetical protein
MTTLTRYRQLMANKGAGSAPASMPEPNMDVKQRGMSQAAAAQRDKQLNVSAAKGLAPKDRALAEARQRTANVIQNFRSASDEQNFDQGGSFNPRAAFDSRERVFDARGQINASSQKEALQKAAQLLQGDAVNTLKRRATREQMARTAEARMQIVAQAMRDTEGFQVLGQELLEPIKDLIDYEGWIRKVMRVRPLGQNEQFRIQKDVRAAAFFVGQDGQGLESQVTGRWIVPPEGKITSYVTADITDIYQSNYDILARGQDTARQEIQLQEDKRGVALLDTAAQAVNTTISYGTLGVGPLEDVRLQVERHRLVVEKFLISRFELSDVIKTMSAQVDPVTERELIVSGYFGSFLNAMIVTAAGTGVEEVIPAGTFYAVTAPEYLGEMGIRIELFSEPFNMFVNFQTKKGWAFAEMVGFGIGNPRSVARGVKL